MQREILFRGKRVDNGEWVYGYYVFDSIGHQIVANDFSCFYINPETVCQFTGLTDKNGVKIFEGGVCKCSHPNLGSVIGKIVYNKELCRFELEFSDSHLNWSFSNIDEFEVIENIYD